VLAEARPFEGEGAGFEEWRRDLREQGGHLSRIMLHNLACWACGRPRGVAMIYELIVI
jgi:hypothetical protein